MDCRNYERKWLVSTWPFPQEDKINLECLSFDEGGTLEPEYSPSPNLDSLYILEFNERSRDITNEEENIEYISHIEIWFQEGTKPRYHPLLQCLFLLNQIAWLILHIPVIIVIFFLYVDKGMFLILIRTWLHWKNSYTWIIFFLFSRVGYICKYVCFSLFI